MKAVVGGSQAGSLPFLPVSQLPAHGIPYYTPSTYSANVTHAPCLPHRIRDKGPCAFDRARMGTRAIQVSRRHCKEPQGRVDRDKRHCGSRPHACQAAAVDCRRGFSPRTEIRLVEMGKTHSSSKIHVAAPLRSVFRQRIGSARSPRLHPRSKTSSHAQVIRGGIQDDPPQPRHRVRRAVSLGLIA